MILAGYSNVTVKVMQIKGILKSCSNAYHGIGFGLSIGG